MPALIVFIALFAVALFGGALLAYPVHALFSNWLELDFERVASRCVLLTLIAIFLLIFRRLGFNSWRDIGYSSSKKDFWTEFPKGFGIGLLIMCPVIAGLLIAKNRFIDLGWDWTIANIFSLMIAAILGGLLIAFIEETLFRGAMLTAIKRQSSTLFAVISTSFIYAFVHFLQPATHLSQDSLNWASGFTVLKNAFMPLLHPAEYIDSFIALFLAGIFLALIKNHTNKLAICIGIHTGWVFCIKIFRRLTNSNVDSGYSFLAGSYDNVIGYLTAFCIAIAIIIFLKFAKRSQTDAV